MSTLLRALALLLVAGLPLALATPQEAAAQACACLDQDGDLECGAADVAVNDSDWLNGTTSGLGGNFPGQTFVLPEGCNKIQTIAVAGGIRVTAQRIVIRGQITSTPVAGQGLLLIAAQDLIVEPGAGGSRPKLVSGGNNALPNTSDNPGIARASVGLKAGTSCTVLNADVTGNPFTAPGGAGSGLIGMQCIGDIHIHGSIFRAGGIDIQSLNGIIYANAEAAQPAAIECDNPALNLLGNGNNNGVLDSGDFPCRLSFTNTTQIVDFACESTPEVPPNQFHAFNNPLVMIAKFGLRLDSPAYPGNILEAWIRLFLTAKSGNINIANADFLNHIPSTVTSGSGIYMFADPVSVMHAPVLQEGAVGPSTGSTELGGACLVSPRNVFFGGTLLGLPRPGTSTVSTLVCKSLSQFIPIGSGP